MRVDHQESAEPATDNQHLVRELGRFATFAELRRSDAYRGREAELNRLLGEPRIYTFEGARPRLRSFLRVVEWNIEHGARLDSIIETLTDHPVLRYADLMLLSELDDGMARSGNLNVAFEMSRALAAHAIYGVEYLEFTKGPGLEQRLAGSNTAALHGVAILTRHEFSRPQVARLPRCEDNYSSAEKRLGGRVGLLADLEVGGRSLLAATTHLDVVNTPRCRARQMRGLLEAIEARSEPRKEMGRGQNAVILGGDLNTHTFARGGRLRSLRNSAIILLGKPEKIARRLADPRKKEPALGELERFGYEVNSLNDHRPTSRAIVSGLDDAARLPPVVKWWAGRRLGAGGLSLDLRLDWLAARGLRVLKAGERTDEETGVTSIDPQTVGGLARGLTPPSDHHPIVVDVGW
jgi:endonuclease/exonuclease/phosphatase family metal-dependent hydrolase